MNPSSGIRTRSATPARRLVPAIVATLLLSRSPLHAQSTGEIAGTVVSNDDRAPISDVQIYLPTLGRGVVSDAAGQFRLAGIPAASYRMVAQRIGFAVETVTVAVRAGVVARVDLQLRSSATVVAPIVVSATRELQRRTEGSVTVDVIGSAEIRQASAAHPAALMNRIPGVHVSELSGEGHSMAMRQPITTKPMYLYLEDGIPTRPTGFFNHNALYEVNLPQSGSVEVIKGPGTALFGSDAIGGVINVSTRPPPVMPSLDVSLEGGTHDYRRLLATGGFTRGDHGVRADLNVTHSDNWKERAPFDRVSATLRWDANLGGTGWTARTVLAGSAIDQQDVPAIARALFDSTPSVNLAPIAYRRARAVRLSSSLELDRGRERWSITPFARLNRMELLPSWQLSYDPQTWDTRNTSLGLMARYRRDFEPRRTRLILGVDADRSPGHFEARRAVVTRAGPGSPWDQYTPGEQQYDYDVTYRQVSPFVHVELSVTRALRVDVGLRGDLVGYAYETGLAPLDTGVHRRPPNTTVSFTHLSPKLGATWELSPEVSVFASYRHGFRAPSQGQLFQQNSAANTVDLEPVDADSYELGVRGQLGARFLYQVAAYDMVIRNDIITYRNALNANEALNAGRTRHRGIEASVAASLTGALHLDASWSVASQRYVTWDPQDGVSYGGRRMEQAPRDLGNMLLGWSPAFLHGGRVAIEWSHTGAYATDPANTQEYGGHDLVNLHLSAFSSSRPEFFARVINLADRRYAELVTWDRFLGNLYTPGVPRTVYAGVRYGL